MIYRNGKLLTHSMWIRGPLRERISVTVCQILQNIGKRGISEMTAFNHNSKKWRRRSKEILRRDKYICQYYKRYGKNVEAEIVHHIFPTDEYPQYAYCGWNLISLSKQAHNMMHDRISGRLTPLGLALQRRAEPQRQAYERRFKG